MIRRCLDSVGGLVDAVVIVDTGSTDDTLDVIRSLEYPVPIHLHQRPWVHFAHNRTELLRLASLVADYLLLLDADQTVHFRHRPPLTADRYDLLVRHDNLEYLKPLLLRAALPWRFEGVTHEYLDCNVPVNGESLPDIYLVEHADSSRRTTGKKFLNDVELLEKELVAKPGDPRSVFYLARSYEDLAQVEPNDPRAADWRRKAQSRYRERAAMTAGYADEAFYSLYRLGAMRLPDGDGLLPLLEAWQRCPHRWEPVHEACRWLNQQRLYEASYALSRHLLGQPPRPAGLFLWPEVYDHLLLFEHSISTYWVGNFQESWDACQTLLAKRLPDYIEAAVRRNMEFARQRLGSAGKALSLRWSKEKEPQL